MICKYVALSLALLGLAISAVPVCALESDNVDFAYINGYSKDLAYPRYAYSSLEHNVYVLTIVLIVLLSLLVISFLALAIGIYVLYDDTSLLVQTRRNARKEAARKRGRTAIAPADSTAPYFPMPAVPTPLVMSGSATMHSDGAHSIPLQMYGHHH